MQGRRCDWNAKTSRLRQWRMQWRDWPGRAGTTPWQWPGTTKRTTAKCRWWRAPHPSAASRWGHWRSRGSCAPPTVGSTRPRATPTPSGSWPSWPIPNATSCSSTWAWRPRYTIKFIEEYMLLMLRVCIVTSTYVFISIFIISWKEIELERRWFNLSLCLIFSVVIIICDNVV